MARQPKKIEIPGDVVAAVEIATPKVKTAKSKVQSANSELLNAIPSDITPAEEVSADIALTYSERMGDWVLTRTGWQFLPDK